MSVSMEILVGNAKITVSGESVEEAFRKAAVVSSFPSSGPNGETDLKFRHRKGVSDAGKPYEYYSIVSESAGKEFQLGQRQDGSGLFPKGWENLYGSENNNNSSVDDLLGVNDNSNQQAAPTPTPTPVPTPAKKTKQNAQQVNDVLAKYGVGGQA